MASLTQHYGFQRLRAGLDSFSLNGSKFTDEDRVILDRLLYLALTGHHHLGAGESQADPTDPPELTLSDSGALPAGERIYYVYTLVDVNGGESAPSPESWVDTPAPVAEPAVVSLSRLTTGGSLLPGAYFYTLSAYTTSNTLDTRASNIATISIPAGTNTNQITINLPDLPSGADGFNIYRRKPGTAEYFYLDSVDMTVDPEPTTYVDDGSVEEDCDRRPSSSNSTNSDNSVVITFPGGTPTIPEGFTWKIYRSYASGEYFDSLLAWVVEETEEMSGIILTEFTDTGQATSPGSPPPSSQITTDPDKVDLETETQGLLPPSRLASFPVCVEFTMPGTTEVMEGPEVWWCPWGHLLVDSIRANVGWDEGAGTMSVPSTSDVELSVMHSSDSGATWEATGTLKIPVGEPNAVDNDFADNVFEDEMIRIDVTSTDDSATPTTPTDIRVYLMGWVHFEDPVAYPE